MSILKIISILISKNINFKYVEGVLELENSIIKILDGVVLFYDYTGEVSHLFTLKEVKTYINNM